MFTHVPATINKHTQQLQGEQTRLNTLLQQTLQEQNFTYASTVKHTLSTVEVLLEQVRPLTRDVIDAKLQSLTTELDELVQLGKYDACTSIKTQLEYWREKQREYPTMVEVQEEIRVLEVQLQSCVEEMRYEDAIGIKERLKVQQEKLQALAEQQQEQQNGTLSSKSTEEQEHQEGSTNPTVNSDVTNEDDAPRYNSRTQLEEDIVNLEGQIKDCIQRKQFALANEHQTRLDEELIPLRAKFPTAQEVRSLIQKAQLDLEECVRTKNFQKANEVQTLLDGYAEQLSALSTSGDGTSNIENTEDEHITSRAHLEHTLHNLQTELTTATNLKQYKTCADLQSRITTLESYRTSYRTASEYNVELQQCQSELEACVQSKLFVKAEEVQQRMDDLTEKYNLELIEEQKYPSAKRVTSSSSMGKGNNTTTVVLQTPKKGSTKITKATPRKLNSALLQTPKQKASARKLTSSTQGANVSINLKTNQSVATSFSKEESSTKRRDKRDSIDFKPVSKLRPKKPIIVSSDSSILDVTRVLASKRADAALISHADGSLAGILTDTDITRRVVSKNIDAATTSVSEVMTSDPKCVHMEDSAMDALGCMVENHFRHLPVINNDESICGLLDIAKCLNDAISKLERSQKSRQTEQQQATAAALQAASQSVQLQALLGPLLSSLSSNDGSLKTKTLRSLLARKPATIVTASTTIRQAAVKMSEARKAALIVDDSDKKKLIGIFGFKDMMTRAVAKQLELDHTAVSEVMTEHPETITPDKSVLEAMQIMHDCKFLTLPVCEEDGRVVGIVDVMDVILGCSDGSEGGWRSIFQSFVDNADDDDTNSLYSQEEENGSIYSSSMRSRKSGKSKKSGKSGVVNKRDSIDFKPVSKLRPKKPIIVSSDSSILDVTRVLASKRADAALISHADGSLAGILTDTDITRRVVSKNIDAATTSVSEVMTSDPKCVHMEDSAMDALGCMVENHFRHLPVINNDESICGLLDIAKCLNDAISKLERSQKSRQTEQQQATAAALQAASQSVQLQALLGPLLSSLSSNDGSLKTKTLRSLLARKPATIVTASTTIRQAAVKMSEARKAALIVDDSDKKKLIGIFGFKDMMTRAVAKQLELDHTAVSEVMTEHPETITPDKSVLEAMQIMHDCKFLTLPVCEEDGRVVGIVDVMDVILGCSDGSEGGWRSIFQSFVDNADDDDTNSLYSQEEKSMNSFSLRSNVTGKSKHTKQSNSMSKKPDDIKPVSKLRPKAPVILDEDSTIAEVCVALASKRHAASVLISDGNLSGILTDHDIVRRVAAKHLDPDETVAHHVMTKDPACVQVSDSALDAIMMMVDNHYRYLPVLDGDDLVGILDISKCLNDAITILEKKSNDTSKPGNDNALSQQLEVLQAAASAGTNAETLQAIFGALLSQSGLDSKAPTLRNILVGKRSSIVHPDMTVLKCSEIMADSHKAALIVDDETQELLGLISFKDVMSRAYAKNLPLESTSVTDIMTPDPESVTPDTTILEAMQLMHDHNFLTLPVVEENGTVCGVVDVMDLIYGCGGSTGWRSIFEDAMKCADDETESVTNQSEPKAPTLKAAPRLMVDTLTTTQTSALNNIPTNIDITPNNSGQQAPKIFSDNVSMLDNDNLSYSFSADTNFVFKVVDTSNGNTFRIRCDYKMEKLLSSISEKVDQEVDNSSWKLTFVDEDGDTVLLKDDDCLAEAVHVAKMAGKQALRVNVEYTSTSKKKKGLMEPIKETPENANTMILAIGGAVVAVCALIFMSMSKKK